MANKINQITIGDALYIQLDNNPRTTGYQAPLGSMAYWQDGLAGKLYLKTGTGNNNWQDLHNSWQYQGNNLNNVSFGIIGSNTGANKDIQFIRNGLEYMRAVENVDPDFDPITLTIANNKVQFKRQNVKGSDYNISSYMTNTHLAEPVLATDREGLVLSSQGYIYKASNLGYFKRQGFASSDPVNEQVYKNQNDSSKGIKAMIPSGGICLVPFANLDFGNPDLLMMELRLLMRRNSDGKLSQLRRTFTIRCDEVNNIYSSVFRQEDYTQYEVGMDIPEVDLVFSNQADTYSPKPLNTCKVTASVSGLNDIENYDIMIWQVSFVLESV